MGVFANNGPKALKQFSPDGRGNFASQPGASTLQDKAAMQLGAKMLGQISAISSNVAAILADRAQDRIRIQFELDNFGRLLLELAPKMPFENPFLYSSSYISGSLAKFKFSSDLFPPDLSVDITISPAQNKFSTEGFGAPKELRNYGFTQKGFENCLLGLALKVKDYKPSEKAAKFLPCLAEMREACLGLPDSASLALSLANMAAIFENASRKAGAPVRITQVLDDSASQGETHNLVIMKENLEFSSASLKDFTADLSLFNAKRAFNVRFDMDALLDLRQGQCLNNEDIGAYRIFRSGEGISLYSARDTLIGAISLDKKDAFKVNMPASGTVIEGKISSETRGFWESVRDLLALNIARGDLSREKS